MRPDLTGRGLGRSAIQIGLRHGREALDATTVRVTVQARNERALTVGRSFGFEDVDHFVAMSSGDQYVIRAPARA